MGLLKKSVIFKKSIYHIALVWQNNIQERYFPFMLLNGVPQTENAVSLNGEEAQKNEFQLTSSHSSKW